MLIKFVVGNLPTLMRLKFFEAKFVFTRGFTGLNALFHKCFFGGLKAKASFEQKSCKE